MAILYKLLAVTLMTLVFITPSLAQDNAYTKGIDVNGGKGAIQWDQVAQQGVRFTYIKASEGNGWPDPKFEENIKSATSNYIWAGAYHFARPNSGNDAVDEAKWFVSVAKDYIKPGYLRPALDIEWDTKSGDVKDSEYLKNWINTWMSTVKDLTGVEPIIYTHHYYVAQCLSGETSLGNYDLWMADTTSDQTPDLAGIWSTWIVWQYQVRSIKGIDPINGEVDQDYLNDNIGGLSYLAIPNPDGYAFGEWNVHLQSDTGISVDDVITFYNDGTFQDAASNKGIWIQNGDAIRWGFDEDLTRPFEGVINRYTMSGTAINVDNEHASWSATKRLGNFAPMA